MKSEQISYVISKQLHYESRDAAVDPNENVDACENHVSCAGDFE